MIGSSCRRLGLAWCEPETDSAAESHQTVHSPNLLRRKCISEVVRISSIIMFHLSKR